MTNEQINKLNAAIEKEYIKARAPGSFVDLDKLQDIANEIVDSGDADWAKKVYIKALQNSSEYDIFVFQNAHEFFKSDRDVVLAAVKAWGPALQYVDEKFKSDREILLATKPYLPAALNYADESFRKDREIIMEAINQCEEGRIGSVIEEADVSLQKDRDVVLAAVKKDGLALQYADKSLQKDKEIVLAALKQNGFALEYASEELQNDPELQKLAEGQSK